MSISVEQLMEESGVRFGTSGARGPATAMTDRVCYSYTCAFLQHLQEQGDLQENGGRVAVAGDLRPSTDRIMEAVCRAVEDRGHQPLLCGKIPSPAVALYGIRHQIPAVMVTGSHIPDDRNGIKFNKPAGEILKPDETGIRRQTVQFSEAQFDATGTFTLPRKEPRSVQTQATAEYRIRYGDAFAPDSLQDLRLGVYQHSAVGRELLVQILESLGAQVTPLGFSHQFIPVDTEAIRPEDVALAQHWAREHTFDAIVSTDGDSDRPLIADEEGCWLRGDVAGVLCAQYLQADSVSTPVSCNTLVERCNLFPEVRRTRIGSPFVIASMQEAAIAGAKRVVGYEANGGFLTHSDIPIGSARLPALPTRDAVIVLLSLLCLARKSGKPLSQLTNAFPSRFTASDRLKDFPQEQSRSILERFSSGDQPTDLAAVQSLFGTLIGKPKWIDRTDGVRITFDNEEIVHLRPSGNAPEFRCYTECAAEDRALELNRQCLQLLRSLN